jgi:hypothetical protein
MQTIVPTEHPMSKPNGSAAIRSGLRRIDALPISAAGRTSARAEFERAEAFADALDAGVRSVRKALATSARTYDERREGLE